MVLQGIQMESQVFFETRHWYVAKFSDSDPQDRIDSVFLAMSLREKKCSPKKSHTRMNRPCHPWVFQPCVIVWSKPVGFSVLRTCRFLSVFLLSDPVTLIPGFRAVVSV